MIPKVIHYCWFGGNDIPEKDLKCIESWKKYCPDYKIIRWDETNYDIHKNKYMEQAYANKKWGFVPDYARFDIIYNEGGFYLDTDVELIKSLDSIRNNEAYMGFESGMFINGGIGFGAEKHNSDIKDLLDMYDNLDFILPNGKLNLTPSPYYITENLQKKGLKRNGEQQKINTMTIYPIDYFAPKDYETGNLNITNNSISIHQYRMSWVDEYNKKQHYRRQKCKKIFGLKLGEILYKIIFLPSRVFHKLKTIGLFKTFMYIFRRKENEK